MNAMQGQMGLVLGDRVNKQEPWEVGFVVSREYGTPNSHRRM